MGIYQTFIWWFKNWCFNKVNKNFTLIHNTTIEISEIEQIWHGVVPPYNKLFNWIFGKGAKPKIEVEKVFHPLMLAHPIEKKDFNNLNPTEFFAEWKWDGIRVQLVLFKSKIRIFSRTGDDISNTFPEIQNNENDLVVLDGELLVGNNFKPFKFNKLQQRLNRKKVSKNHLENFPAFVKLYDILFLKNKDLRSLDFSERRNILSEWHNKIQNKFNKRRQIKVKNTLKFLTDISKTFRKSIDTNIIAITGSCGKTTLKELLGNVLSKISKVSISPKSYNNKFGVPLSLFNLKQNDEFGIFRSWNG